MRVTCPNCASQYDLPDGVVPASGRELRCSECGHVWFHRPQQAGTYPVVPTDPAEDQITRTEAQDAPDTGKAEAPVEATVETPAETPAEATGDATTDNPASQRRAVDPNVLNILREEAAFESARRAEEVAKPGFPSADQGQVTQPVEPQEKADPIRAAIPPVPRAETVAIKPEPPSAYAAASASAGFAETGTQFDAPEPVRRRLFWRGVIVSWALLALAFAVYANTERVTAVLPQTAPALNVFVEQVDAGRHWVDQTSIVVLDEARKIDFVNNLLGPRPEV